MRRDGLRVPASESHLVARRIASLEISDTLSAELFPVFTVLAPINEQIVAADRRLAALVAGDPDMTRLATMPSIGPVTAAAVVATVDDVTRFASAHQFEAFLGVVPSERSSGETRRLGRITKAGNARVRYLLVEAGWRILRAKDPELAALRAGGCGSPSAAGSASRPWRWRVGCRGFCMRCGGADACLIIRIFECGERER